MKRTLKLILIVSAIALITASAFWLVSCDFNSNNGDATPMCDEHIMYEISCTADCTHAGERIMGCKFCPYTESTTVDAFGHDIEEREVRPATCYENGWVPDKFCMRCKQTIEYGYSIPAGHTEVVIEGTPATCTRSGLTDGKKCTTCGAVLVEQEKIPAGHTEVVLEAVEATCTEAGLTEGRICSVCGFVFVEQETIPAGHKLVTVLGYSATCTTDGLTDFIKCSSCDEVIQEATVIPASHAEVTVPGYAATCEADGLTDGKVCNNCGTVTLEQTVIPAGHTVKTLEGYAATCTRNGLTDGSVCASCGLMIKNQTAIVTVGHTFGEDGKCKGCDLRFSVGLEYEAATGYEGYDENYDTYYVVTGYGDCKDTEVVIPDVYNGGLVVEIADYAFQNCTVIVKVTLPGSIEYVGDSAFVGCSELKEIECEDFDQLTDWNENWRGGIDVKIKAVFNQGKTPYQIYLEAMNITGHNYDRYVYTTEAFTYFATNGVVDRSSPVMIQRTHQKQCVNNCYYMQSVIDYGSGETVEEKTEIYYIDGYIYQPNYMIAYNTYEDIKLRASLEFWYGTMTLSDMEFLTEPFFKCVEYYMDIDGTMHLYIEMDQQLITEYVEKISGQDFPMELNKVVYSYTFDTEGRICSFTCETGFPMGQATDDYGNAVSLDCIIEMTGSFDQLGTLERIDLPAIDWVDCSVDACTNHTPVTVPEFPATCYMDGRTECSYCANCLSTVVPFERTSASHKYENGECSECGELEYGSTGLSYVLNDEETGYIVVGVGGNTEYEVVIPRFIYGLPVVKVNSDAFKDSRATTIEIDGTKYPIDEFYGWEK